VFMPKGEALVMNPSDDLVTSIWARSVYMAATGNS
jgi:hypothetical protein